MLAAGIRCRRTGRSPRTGASRKPAAKSDVPAAGPRTRPAALTFTEKHRLETLPRDIERLEAEIAKLEALLADPDLFTRDPGKFQTATKALALRQERLTTAEEEWLALAERAEAG